MGMLEYMSELGAKGDLKALVKEIVTSPHGTKIEKQAHTIFPIKDCYIRKAKILKKPKFDVTELMEWHNADEVVSSAVVAAEGGTGDAGTPVEAPTEELGTVAGSGGRL